MEKQPVKLSIELQDALLALENAEGLEVKRALEVVVTLLAREIAELQEEVRTIKGL